MQRLLFICPDEIEKNEHYENYFKNITAVQGWALFLLCLQFVTLNLLGTDDHKTLQIKDLYKLPKLFFY